MKTWILLSLMMLVSTPVSCQDTEPLTAASDSPSEHAEPLPIDGRWQSSFGTLDLSTIEGSVSGSYELGTLRGSLSGNRLTFRYVEQGVQGEGQFTFAKDRRSFEGKWKPDGKRNWKPWDGDRGDLAFQVSGLWEFPFGRTRLQVDGDSAAGVFRLGPSTSAIQGKVTGERRIDFEFDSLGDQQGEGWFQLSKDGTELLGAWKIAGKPWLVRTAKRVPVVPNRIWLVVVEINWETGLEQKRYVFGNMLREYFRVPDAQHVDFRHRIFHDLDDLQRFSHDVAFLPGPVVFVLSSHGSPRGVEVANDLIDASELSSCLTGVSNIEVLHLSGCAMMAGNFARDVQKQLIGLAPAISGYQTFVDWDASAIADFQYLTMLLIHRLDPKSAVKEAIRAAPYLGDDAGESTILTPLRLSVLDVPERKTE